jgi:hypothetical protein
MANLATTYRKQDRWEEAEQLEMQVMEIRKTKLGVDHPSTLTSMTNLASTYRKQGRWEEAEQLEVQVMETRKTKLGEDLAYTLLSSRFRHSSDDALGILLDSRNAPTTPQSLTSSWIQNLQEVCFWLSSHVPLVFHFISGHDQSISMGSLYDNQSSLSTYY